MENKFEEIGAYKAHRMLVIAALGIVSYNSLLCDPINCDYPEYKIACQSTPNQESYRIDLGIYPAFVSTQVSGASASSYSIKN